jgi:hypothetical protein
VVYGGPREAPIAETILKSAREFYQARDEEGLPGLTFDQALNYLVAVFNMRYLSEEERAAELQGLPQDVIDGMTAVLAEEPEAESPLLILDFRTLPAGQPDPERLFLLVQPL